MLALRNISGVKRNMSLSQRVTHYRVIGDLLQTLLCVQYRGNISSTL